MQVIEYFLRLGEQSVIAGDAAACALQQGLQALRLRHQNTIGITVMDIGADTGRRKQFLTTASSARKNISMWTAALCRRHCSTRSVTLRHRAQSMQ